MSGHPLRLRSASMSSRIVDGFSDGESLAGDGDVEDSAAMESYHCFACEEEDTLHNLPECRSNRLFHKRCWNGVRAYVRTLPKGSGVTLQYKHKFLHNPVQWRQDVRGFLGDDLEFRNQARVDAPPQVSRGDDHGSRQGGRGHPGHLALDAGAVRGARFYLGEALIAGGAGEVPPNPR